MSNMEYFSLEDEDCSQLFITQESSNDKNNGITGEECVEKDGFNEGMEEGASGEACGFVQPIYSDILNDDFEVNKLEKKANFK